MGTQGIWSVYENACASIRCRRFAAPVDEQLGAQFPLCGCSD